MSIQYVFSYFRRCNSQLREISKKEGASLFKLWIDCIWVFFRYGCAIRQYSVGQFYRYSSFDRNQITTTRKYFKLVKRTNDPAYTHFLENKEEFNEKFSAYVKRKWLTSNSMSESSFALLCKSGNGIIVKPLDGMEGDGIYIIESKELDDDEKVKLAYKRLKEENVIIEEVIRQHPKMVFNNKSVNTIRTISIMDKDTHEVNLFKAVLRAGVGESVVDNFHQGGCCYEVDVASGRVCSRGLSAAGGNHLFHPGTDTCMLGFQIPNWDKVVNGCIQAHKLLPQCRYISWDVAITENGMELIEGNHNGDYDMIEFVGSNKYWPLLKKYL